MPPIVSKHFFLIFISEPFSEVGMQEIFPPDSSAGRDTEEDHKFKPLNK